MYNQDEGGIVPLGPGLMSVVTTSKLEMGLATVSFKTTHLDEDVGGSDHILAKAGETDCIDCMQVIADLNPACVEKGRQPTA